jgi:hypothetical protein
LEGDARLSAPRSEAFLDDLRREFPGLRIVDKTDSDFCRAIDAALRVVTFGAQSAFTTKYTTVLGRTIYLPSAWPERSDLDRYVTLRHEAIHLRQFERYGTLGMALLYLFPIFPLGLALGRARIEWEAYAETLRATAEVRGIEAAADPALHEHIVRQFTSGAYGWMWPFRRKVLSWIAAEVAKLQA